MMLELAGTRSLVEGAAAAPYFDGLSDADLPVWLSIFLSDFSAGLRISVA
jgi:hypothetical protein